MTSAPADCDERNAEFRRALNTWGMDVSQWDDLQLNDQSLIFIFAHLGRLWFQKFAHHYTADRMSYITSARIYGVEYASQPLGEILLKIATLSGFDEGYFHLIKIVPVSEELVKELITNCEEACFLSAFDMIQDLMMRPGGQDYDWRNNPKYVLYFDYLEEFLTYLNNHPEYQTDLKTHICDLCGDSEKIVEWYVQNYGDK